MLLVEVLETFVEIDNRVFGSRLYLGLQVTDLDLGHLWEDGDRSWQGIKEADGADDDVEGHVQSRVLSEQGGPLQNVGRNR